MVGPFQANGSEGFSVGPAGTPVEFLSHQNNPKLLLFLLVGSLGLCGKRLALLPRWLITGFLYWGMNFMSLVLLLGSNSYAQQAALYTK